MMPDWLSWSLAAAGFAIWIVRRVHRFRNEDAREDRRRQAEDADWERTRAALERSARRRNGD